MSQPSFDLDVDDGTEITYTVGELGEAINGALRRGFSEGVWVRGEINGWREGPNGHAYFNLVDDTAGVKATIAVSLFATSRMRLRPMLAKLRLRLGDGMKVRINGFLDFYAPNGRLGMKMAGLDPRYTLGEIALARAETIRRLVAEGLYDANRARPLPMVPLRIGVVTSVGSAAWHDFAHELNASGFGFRLTVADVRVQGDGAVAMVAGAIRALSRYAITPPIGAVIVPGTRRRPELDAIVVVRGGGARTDLAAFDAEDVARAIAECPVAVLTGLGHEIDRSVADEVAARSLKTPTACAGALIEQVLTYRDRTEALWSTIGRLATTRLDRHERRLGDLASRTAAATTSATRLATERLDRATGRVPVAARRTLSTQIATVERASARVGGESRRHLAIAEVRLDGLAGRTRALDPAATLARGWSITRLADGRLLTDPSDAPAGSVLVTTIAGGDVTSRVETDAVAIPRPAAATTSHRRPVTPTASSDRGDPPI